MGTTNTFNNFLFAFIVFLLLSATGMTCTTVSTAQATCTTDVQQFANNQDFAASSHSALTQGEQILGVNDEMNWFAGFVQEREPVEQEENQLASSGDETEDQQPDWVLDYYAALDTMDDDLMGMLVRRNTDSGVDIQAVSEEKRLEKRKGGGGGGGSSPGWWRSSFGSSGSSSNSGTGKKGGGKPSPKYNSNSNSGTGKKGGGKPSPKYNSNSNSGTGKNGGGKSSPKYNSNSKSGKIDDNKSKISNSAGASSSGGSSEGSSSPRYSSSHHHHHYYGGGCLSPYSAGLFSPMGLLPYFMSMSLAGAVFAGFWMANLYSYPWHNPIHYDHPNDRQPMMVPYTNSSTTINFVNSGDSAGNATAGTQMAPEHNATQTINVQVPVPITTEDDIPTGILLPDTPYVTPATASEPSGTPSLVARAAAPMPQEPEDKRDPASEGNASSGESAPSMSADDAPLSYFTIAPGEKIGLPVICLCVEGAECGCDETDDPGYAEGVLQDVVNSEGRGPIARINVVNGELTLVVNGTVRSETSGTRRIQRDASMWHAVLGVVVVGGMYMAGFA